MSLPERPLPGPTKIDCPCDNENCTIFGTVKKNGHVKGCKCRRCLGGRNRYNGMRKQRAAKKALGIPNNRFRTKDGNEENWLGAFRVEVKSGKMVGKFAGYFKAEAQSERNRAVGDSRPFIFVAMPEGMGNEGFVVVRLSNWRAHVAPHFEER